MCEEIKDRDGDQRPCEEGVKLWETWEQMNHISFREEISGSIVFWQRDARVWDVLNAQRR